MVHDELPLSEITFHLIYSSVNYIGNQVKKVTGQTPSHCKQIKSENNQQTVCKSYKSIPKFYNNLYSNNCQLCSILKQLQNVIK